MNRVSEVNRKTRETKIRLRLDMDNGKRGTINTGIPFFNHMLEAMSFHGGFELDINAIGDTEVDFHHTVEDIGLVLGDALWNIFEQNKVIERFGYAVIPMDDALSEVVVDVCGRPFLRYTLDFAQPLIGSFDLSLMREFFYALSVRAKINLHINVRYGINNHHIMESVFKALGKALRIAYTLRNSSNIGISTKGLI